MLWTAKEDMDCDAFCCTTIQGITEQMCEDLGFLKGDGAFHYYLVNWSLGDVAIEDAEVGTFLV